MTRPAILDAIDAALVDKLPDGIRAIAEGDVLSAVQDEIGGPMLRRVTYQGVTISRSLAQIENGWMVRILDGFDRHPRDPETGQFIARED
jgi:hypothetical protein